MENTIKSDLNCRHINFQSSRAIISYANQLHRRNPEFVVLYLLLKETTSCVVKQMVGLESYNAIQMIQIMSVRIIWATPSCRFEGHE